MTLTLLEGAVDALDTYLQANITAKIANLNVRYTDDTLPPIGMWYQGSLPLVTPDNPSVVIHGSGFTPITERAANLHYTNNVELVVFVGHDNVEVRFRRLCRYILGFIEMVHSGESSIGYKISIAGAIRLSDAMSTSPFLAGMILPLNMVQIETF